MKRSMAILAVVAFFFALAAPASATTTRIPVSATETYRVIDGGRTWFSNEGRIMHVRGWTAVSEAEGGNYVTGDGLLTASWNLDLATGDGTMWGTASYVLDAFDGGFAGSWTATFGGFAWSGRGVYQGFGELHAWQGRVAVWATGCAPGVTADGCDAFAGYYFRPGE